VPAAVRPVIVLVAKALRVNRNAVPGGSHNILNFGQKEFREFE
jgi:hypothetical protein